MEYAIVIIAIIIIYVIGYVYSTNAGKKDKTKNDNR